MSRTADPITATVDHCRVVAGLAALPEIVSIVVGLTVLFCHMPVDPVLSSWPLTDLLTKWAASMAD